MGMSSVNSLALDSLCRRRLCSIFKQQHVIRLRRSSSVIELGGVLRRGSPESAAQKDGIGALASTYFAIFYLQVFSPQDFADRNSLSAEQLVSAQDFREADIKNIERERTGAACDRSPTKPDRDRPQVGRDPGMFAVQVAELGIEIDVRTNLARDAPAEILSKLIEAGVQELPINRKTAIEAMPPPGEERIACRSWGGGRGIKLARAMVKRRASDDVAAPVLADRNIDDRAQHERVNVIGRAGRARRLQR